MPRLVAKAPLLEGCRTPFAAAALFSLAINLLMLTSAFYMFQVYDRVLVSRSVETLSYLTLIALFSLATLGLLDMIRSRILTRLGAWIEQRLSLPVLARSIDAANFGQSAGAQRLADLGQIRSFFSGPGILALFDTPWVPVYLLAIYLLHPYLGHFTLFGAVLLLGLAILSERLTHRTLKEASASSVFVLRGAEAVVRNAGTIDALGLLGNISNRWSRCFQHSRRQQLKANALSSAILSLTKFSRMGLQVAILGLGAYLVIQEEITAGAMIAASILLGRALAPIEQANANIRQAVGAWDAGRRLKAFLAMPSRRGKSMLLPTPTGELVVSQVFYSPHREWNSQSRGILNGISFDARPGELVAVIGPSASGKSTLARLLVGIQSPGSGTVRLDGAEVFAWERADFGRHVGYLPQELELFSGSVKDNIARMGEPDPAAVADAARLAGCHEMILKLPRGYETEIGEGGLLLSGGQRQRIALARAFYGKPSLLVLDEPDASLDSDGDAALIRALATSKSQGCTIVVIAHRPNILAGADKILLLREGKVDLFGPREAVAAQLAKRTADARKRVLAISSANVENAQAGAAE